MVMPHKGDRERVTLRLPRTLVDQVDQHRNGEDRNSTIALLIAEALLQRSRQRR